MKTYAIRNVKCNNNYWSHEWGWILVEGDSEDTFSIFTKEEKEKYEDLYDLPVDGEWVEL